MPSFQTLLYSIADGVCTITLNRPEVYNAFNEQLKQELNDALKEAEKDSKVRCLVIRGAGDKAFCSGQDLKEHSSLKRSLKDSLEKSYNPMIRKIRAMVTLFAVVMPRTVLSRRSKSQTFSSAFLR